MQKNARVDEYFEMLILAVAKHAHQHKEMSKRCAAATVSETVRHAGKLAVADYGASRRIERFI